MGTRFVDMSEALLLELIKGEIPRLEKGPYKSWVTVNPPFPKDVTITSVGLRFVDGYHKVLRVFLYSKEYKGEEALSPEYTVHYEYEGQEISPAELAFKLEAKE